MRTVETIAAVRRWRGQVGGSVGLVPTMGFLHAGHLALVEKARAENDAVVATIFVNPAQFNREADLTAYPRDPERDGRLLEGAGCDLLFAPSPGEMYPPGFATWIEPGPVAEPNEGTHRPGHFRGVATVVLKLFGIVEPHRAYFGEKDAQQLAVVRAMVRDLDVPVEVVSVPTVREADGLAMSSRNVRLEAKERGAATVLHRSLVAAREVWRRGERDGEALRREMRRVVSTEPAVSLDYVSVACPQTFEELAEVRDEAVLSLAAELGTARLIDALTLTPAHEESP